MTTSCYIHIPFCRTICSYCNFTKTLYKEDMVDTYLNALEEEIKERYQNEPLKTIYIGGGSPDSLNEKQLEKLMQITNLLDKNVLEEFTVECNIENITEEKLKILKKGDVNRISIGVQTLNEKFLKYLNRNHTISMVYENVALVKKYFDNISIDLIYAVKDQTLADLDEDITKFMELDINHIAMYSLIIEKNTKIYQDKDVYIDEDLDANMHELIIKRLKEHGYDHYETSNFGKNGYFSKHNLIYWDNKEYYGFGLGASGYVNGIRYKNTPGFRSYINKEYIKEAESQTKELKMSYEMILGLRKKSGVSIEEFTNKYQENIYDIYEINKLLTKKMLVLENGYLKIPENMDYIANEILIYFI